MQPATTKSERTEGFSVAAVNRRDQLIYQKFGPEGRGVLPTVEEAELAQLNRTVDQAREQALPANLDYAQLAQLGAKRP